MPVEGLGATPAFRHVSRQLGFTFVPLRKKLSAPPPPPKQCQQLGYPDDQPPPPPTPFEGYLLIWVGGSVVSGQVGDVQDPRGRGGGGGGLGFRV